MLNALAAQSRPINPNKDIAVYGYGTVAWKDRVDDWKRKQLIKLQRPQLEGGDGGSLDGDGLDNPDLPM